MIFSKGSELFLQNVGARADLKSARAPKKFFEGSGKLLFTKVSHSPPKKIGVLGGSFDPVHFGHLKCAEALIEQGVVDRVLFMPTGRHAHKDTRTPAKDRLKMLQLAVEGNPFFEVSSYEIHSKKTSYTVNTLAYLKKENPELQYFFILGADTLKMFHAWKNYRELIRDNDFILLRRPGFSLSRKSAPKLTKYEFEKLTSQRTSTPLLKISATSLRTSLKNEEKSLEKTIPKKVLSYIYAKKLYS
jgi:nicotinate-nucleotide adenylyltransferase